MILYTRVILAIIQGITELLPISSSGHLLISSIWLQDELSLGMLTFLHFWTGLAILIGYRKEIFEIIYSKNKWSILISVCLTIIPAGIVGFLFDDQIQEIFYNPFVIASMFLIWGVIMIYVERRYVPANKPTVDSIEKISPLKAFLIGIFQMLALIPGTSRSGVTTVGGLLFKVEKSLALEYSFISGLPLIFASFFYETFKSRSDLSSIFNGPNFVYGGVAFIVGLISVYILKVFSKKDFLTVFGFYRILMSVVILAYVIFR